MMKVGKVYLMEEKNITIFCLEKMEKITYEDNFFIPSIKYLDLPFARLDE